jgi:hypothetical protein
VTEEESKVQEMGGKMVAKDYDRLKEFAAKVKRHVEVEVSEYFINKRARELIAEVNLLRGYEETFTSLEYLSAIDLGMISDHYQGAIDQTAGRPLPE